MKGYDLKKLPIKAALICFGLMVFGFALMGSFYVATAISVVMLFTMFLSDAGMKSRLQPVKVKSAGQPLETECRVIRRK